MGWFSDLLFGGSPAKTAEDTVLPKQVQSWEENGSTPESGAAVSSRNEATSVSPRDGFKTQSGSKIIPNVTVERLEPHLSSDMKQVEVWAHIKNFSRFEVEVRRINFLQQHTEPGRFLKPGESHEIRIYAGDTPRSNAEHKAEVQYKIVDNDDYFQADHRIDYRYERNEHGEFYIPEELHIILPIRDI